jgi:hypothetical protein
MSYNRLSFKRTLLSKYGSLVVGLIFDAVGLVSYTIPALGEFTDVLVAPLQGLFIYFYYEDTTMAIISVTEELTPFDFIPSCTIAWFRKYYK